MWLIFHWPADLAVGCPGMFARAALENFLPRNWQGELSQRRGERNMEMQ
jgi:hypothetical protein